MRHSSYVTRRQLGLTDEEVAFLQPQAQAMFASFAKASKYDPEKKQAFTSFLDEAQVVRLLQSDPRNAVKIKVLQGLAHPSASAEGKTRTLETVLDKKTGLGLKHSSFGGIKVGSPSGADALLVGSASLGHHCKSIGFTSGQITIDVDSEPFMSGGNISLIELIMSVEQYCMFIRGNKGIFTPCGMSRTGQWADDAPQLTHAKSNQRDLAQDIKQAAKPMSTKLAALVQLVKQGASKKSEYAELVTAAEQAHSFYREVAGEIAAIVKAAGMKEGQVAQQQFEADLNERLGQLKLGSPLHAILRSLGHDTSPNDDQSE
ncbi:hypothetical protein [Pseudomonas serbica]|uniref:hypothetical protein n=1 Tax=Pseudomonas serbica TaxID=2965074 RepID=UPI00237AE6B3|nr:hypothetical protein [Pseudomonas serbica]